MDILTKNPGEAKQFTTKVKAQTAAKAIGWNKTDVVQAEIMGFYPWVISDPHMNFVSREGYEQLLKVWR